MSQLRTEDRAETLRDLESRFRELLVKQRAVNETTLTLAGVGRQNFRRTEHLQLADLSVKQRHLAERAAACVHILDEEGTTVVFPRVVRHVQEDMSGVADRLAAHHVDAITQGIEQEIVETLEGLLESVKRMQQENEQMDGSPGGDGGDSPLLPRSAELKLLRATQMRVNGRTATIETARNSGDVTEVEIRESLDVTAARQAECSEIAREIRDRKNQP